MTLSKEVLASLTPAERSRQQKMHELLETERNYVRGLHVLRDIFRDPLLAANAIHGNKDLGQRLRAVFASLDLVTSSGELVLQALEKRVGHEEVVVVGRADATTDSVKAHEPTSTDATTAAVSSASGSKQHHSQLIMGVGDIFNAFRGIESYANYCANQASALETLRSLVREHAFIACTVQAGEARAECKRLSLSDHINSVFQRLARYPLLLETVLKSTPKDHADREPLQQAISTMRAATRYVNHAVFTRQNSRAIRRIQRRLEIGRISSGITSSPSRLDAAAIPLPQLRPSVQRYACEGRASWLVVTRRGTQRQIPVHFAILSDMILFMQPCSSGSSSSSVGGGNGSGSSGNSRKGSSSDLGATGTATTTVTATTGTKGGFTNASSTSSKNNNNSSSSSSSSSSRNTPGGGTKTGTTNSDASAATAARSNKASPTISFAANFDLDLENLGCPLELIQSADLHEIPSSAGPVFHVCNLSAHVLPSEPLCMLLCCQMLPTVASRHGAVTSAGAGSSNNSKEDGAGDYMEHLLLELQGESQMEVQTWVSEVQKCAAAALAAHDETPVQLPRIAMLPPPPRPPAYARAPKPVARPRSLLASTQSKPQRPRPRPRSRANSSTNYDVEDRSLAPRRPPPPLPPTSNT